MNGANKFIINFQKQQLKITEKKIQLLEKQNIFDVFYEEISLGIENKEYVNKLIELQFLFQNFKQRRLDELNLYLKDLGADAQPNKKKKKVK